MGFQEAGLRQGDREIKPGLSPESRKDRIRSLPLDELLHNLRAQRLDIDMVRDLTVRHDCRGIRVQQNDLHSLLPERAAGLRASVIKFRRLADHDRTRSDDKNLPDAFISHALPPSYP